MKLATIFRLKENLTLDRKTLIILRYIAIVGQIITINLVYHLLKLDFPIFQSHLVIFFGLLSNIYLQFGIKSNQLKDFYAALFLVLDLLQLSLLLYMTGGILNPFSFLIIIPAIVSSTFLSMGTTIILGILTSASLLFLSFYYLPLPGVEIDVFTFPIFYRTGIFISITIGLIFLSYFGIRFAGETKKRSEALNKLQQVISKEYELESLGGQAAAAAHSLGTPLATISVVAKELKKEIGDNKEISKDIDLLISQTKRCSEILKKISKKQIIEDSFFKKTNLENLLSEILESFKETTSKRLSLNTREDKNKLHFKRTPELVYGLRNFIGNAIKFSKSKVEIIIDSNIKTIKVIINDDGPGFPDDIIKNLGEPYIKSKSNQVRSNSGTGLGTFLGKTLLERQLASLFFSKDDKLGGASVVISWSPKNILL